MCLLELARIPACDIRSGLKPVPSKPKGCTVDWTGGYQVGPTGRAHKVCAGDTAPLPRRAGRSLRNNLARRSFHLQIELLWTPLQEP